MYGPNGLDLLFYFGIFGLVVAVASVVIGGPLFLWYLAHHLAWVG